MERLTVIVHRRHISLGPDAVTVDPSSLMFQSFRVLSDGRFPFAVGRRAGLVL
ncbi:hypothetical protein CCACVL1_03002 [Corchorus capsularis]|uniref:Uncharacterized protein n=1 Tax=Corchorus capsularis TaxID=210143 RepID=A0A1R3K3X2_COCAP|nr:hypothetical protein CCACVL1_03002 [Corchorus capsularis]